MKPKQNMVQFKFEGAVPLKSQQLATWLLNMHDIPPDFTLTKQERIWAVYIVVMMNANHHAGGAFYAGVQDDA